MDIFRGRKKEEKLKTRLGDNIRVTRSRLTKIPERVVEIDAYPTSLKEGTVPVTEENAELTFKGFFKEHKDVFEIEPEDLKLVFAKKLNKRWYVKYGQYYKGIPVHNATVGLESSENGKVATYAANYHPEINVPTEPIVNVEDATDIALKTYQKKDRPNLKRKDQNLIIYPEKIEDQITYHLAWKFLIVGEEPDPEIEKFFIVDAIDGKIIKSYTARFPGAQVTGTVLGEIYPENPTDPISTMPIRNEYVDIENAGTATTTNNSGNYKKTVNWFWQFLNWPFGEATFTLNGPYARVQNNNGANYTEKINCNTSSPCNHTWTAADRDHINVFYHMNLFHDWLEDELGYAWVNPWTGTSRFNARVNYNFANAYAGDPMEFGTNNFARSSDVIYHECTHNVLYHIYGDYIGYPNKYTEAYAMDEGFADYFACSFTNESIQGEGCSATPRNLKNNEQYPGKSNYNSEGHTGGLIIGGAAWNLRQRLISIYGAPGARIADQLILEAHQILSIYPRDYYFSDPKESNLLSALYRAADTDNNLLNGFPYLNDIQNAFHAHSLLQVVLEDRDSFDFSTNSLGTLTGGDLYYSGGKFWANNINQKGVTNLGNVGDVDLTTVNIPTAGYTRFGVNAVSGHTYISKAQEGELGSYIVFRVTDISADKSNVTIQYFYLLTPLWYIANLNSKEIHKPDCRWVSLMAVSNKSYCKSLQEVAGLVKNSGYNGCHFCLPRYDTDTLTINKVLENLNEDLQ
jgi:Zn-dependent metalloprotease